MNELKVLKRKRNIFLALFVAFFVFFCIGLNTLVNIDDDIISLILLLIFVFIAIILLFIICKPLGNYLNIIRKLETMINLPTVYTEVSLLTADNEFDKDLRETLNISTVFIKRGEIKDLDIKYIIGDQIKMYPISLEEARKFVNFYSIK